jgi:hypothetical protein
MNATADIASRTFLQRLLTLPISEASLQSRDGVSKIQHLSAHGGKRTKNISAMYTSTPQTHGLKLDD